MVIWFDKTHSQIRHTFSVKNFYKPLNKCLQQNFLPPICVALYKFLFSLFKTTCNSCSSQFKLKEWNTILSTPKNVTFWYFGLEISKQKYQHNFYSIFTFEKRFNWITADCKMDRNRTLAWIRMRKLRCLWDVYATQVDRKLNVFFEYSQKKIETHSTFFALKKWMFQVFRPELYRIQWIILNKHNLTINFLHILKWKKCFDSSWISIRNVTRLNLGRRRNQILFRLKPSDHSMRKGI